MKSLTNPIPLAQQSVMPPNYAEFNDYSRLRLPMYSLLICVGLTICPKQSLAEDIQTQAPTLESAPLSPPAPLPASEPPAPMTPVQAIITSQHHPFLTAANFPNRAEDLNALYQPTNYQLLWLNKPSSEQNINDVISLLSSAADYGLNPEHYDVQLLRTKQTTALNEQDQAAYDTALSLSLIRFLHDLHYGRVNPQDINFNLKLREKKLIDLPLLIKTHLEQQTLLALPPDVEPKLLQYQKLKTALSQYKKLAEKASHFKLAFKKALRPGDTFSDVSDLRDMLVTLGDLPENTALPEKADKYSDKLVVGIKNFQRRHGLAADGVIGKTTAEELSTPVDKRVQQIELAMERLRWLPELSSDPSIIVNIPAFQLWTYENVNDPNTKMTNMRVVVGKAMKNQTPVLMATMSYIDFSPYWNVPYNIVKDELLPKLSPGFLAKENMELVSNGGVTGYSAATAALLKQGTVRIRQKPGKKNALGRVKFLFPNKNDVYLHDTPANSLFSRSRRDFSHGCVRVAKPQELAEFALKEQKNWDKAAIAKAMQAGKLQRVILKKPIPVIFFYTTAFFDEHDQLTFYPDIYAQDTVLQEALKKTDDISDQVLIASTPPPEPQPEPVSNNTTTDSLKTVDVGVVR